MVIWSVPMALARQSIHEFAGSGGLIEQGLVADVIGSPADSYTRNLIEISAQRALV